MLDVFLEGGWTTYPTALFGAGAIAAGVVVALRPDRRFVPLLVSLCALTVGSGIMGTMWGLTGIVKVATNAAAEDVRALTLACATQALNSLLLASVCVVIALIAATSGALRVALSPATRPATA